MLRWEHLPGCEEEQAAPSQVTRGRGGGYPMDNPGEEHWGRQSSTVTGPSIGTDWEKQCCVCLCVCSFVRASSGTRTKRHAALAGQDPDFYTNWAGAPGGLKTSPWVPSWAVG